MNPLLTFDEIAHSLACPRCKSPLVGALNHCFCSNPACPLQSNRFRTVGSHLVLVDFNNSILAEDKVFSTGATSLVVRRKAGFLKSVILKMLFPTSGVTIKNIDRFIELAKEGTPQPTILVVGGGTVGSGTNSLYRDSAVRLIAFDVYGSPLTQIVADGHQIPLRDQSVDGVLIQAVLEHVLEPAKVVAEIHRVLKPNGVVYAETPFLQQVHEGAYDFTRFTESGHRYLFRRFAVIDSGAVQGPGTQARWTISHLGRSIFRSTLVEKLLLLMFFWVAYLDYFCGRRETVDGACGVFFLGKKSDRELTPREMVEYYQGAQ